MAPSPSVFLAAVAQRTRRLRFGPMIYALPLYHPLRMIEEICMLDQMSGGRLDVGFGRGASPIELDLFGTNPADARDIYDEALAIVVQGPDANARVSFKGKHLQLRQRADGDRAAAEAASADLVRRARQRQRARAAPEQGLNVISLDGVAATRGFSDSYRAAWNETGRAGPMPKFGLGRMLVVADTDAEALRLAERAYPMWHDSFNSLFKVYGRMPMHPRPPKFSGIMADGRGLCGSPATVTEIDPQADGGGGRRLFRRPVRVRRPDACRNAAFHRAVRPRVHAGAAGTPDVEPSPPFDGSQGVQHGFSITPAVEPSARQRSG